VPDGQDPAEFVLENFVGRDVKGKVEIMIEAAAEAVRVAVNEGLETAMNRFNKSLP
jgi:peptidyl-tRNA hydrolase